MDQALVTKAQPTGPTQEGKLRSDEILLEAVALDT